MKTRILALGLSATALTPLGAQAQDSLMLDEIVASAGLLPVAVNRTGATVETVDATELAERDQEVVKTLDTLPGISSTTNGGLGQTATLRIRGLGNTYIAVRIDGIDFASPAGTQTAFNFGTFTKGQPGRVEVLKGSQSAIYGSNAIAGVVDITTWRPEKLGFSGVASLEAGTWDTYSGTLNLGQMTERGEVALTFSRVTSHGFPARTSDEEDDGFDQTSLALSAAYDLTEDVRLGFSTIYSDSSSEFDRSEFDPTGESDETRKGGRIYADFRTGAVDNEIAASIMESELYDEGGFTERFVGTRRKLEYQGSADLSASAALAFGADWTEEEAKLDDTTYDADSSAVFGELQYAPSDALDLSLSLRYDAYEDFDSQLSGRAAMAWRLQDDLILRAVLGNGYRAPSLYERFGPYTAADADLQPEKSRSAEIGIEKAFGTDSFAKATLFYTEIDDLIDYDFATSSYGQVPGTTTSQGVELSGQYAVTDAVALFGNYTYTDTSNADGRMVRVPRHDVNLGVEGNLSDRLSGRLALQYIADRVDIDTWPNPPSSLDDYTLINASLSYALTDKTDAYLRIENLTDEEYQPVRGYNGAGRAMYVGLRATF